MGQVRKRGLIERRLIQSGIFSWICLIIIIIYQSVKDRDQSIEGESAEKYMMEMIDQIAGYCSMSDMYIDTLTDIGKTGLIGPELTGIVTTAGQLEAKRTSIQPAVASVITGLLAEAGVKQGDTICLGCSGSFPGLLLASMAASKSMGLHCRTIISIGASSYGATRPGFTILEIYRLLLDHKLIDDPPAGVSLGGENDSGMGWDPEIRKNITDRINASGYYFIQCDEFISCVDKRDSLYGFRADSGVKVFINAGGAMANIGTSPSILGMKPGLVKTFRIPEKERQGAIHRSLKAGIPVIHLLNMKGLAREYGLRWDPAVIVDNH